MDAVTLRVLTRKSKFKFGKYSDMTVRDVLICAPYYIARTYYYCANISFADDILDEMQIMERLSKPSKDPDAYLRWLRAKSRQYSDEEREHNRFIQWHKQKKKAKAAYTRARIYEDAASRKGILQTRNQGKMNEK